MVLKQVSLVAASRREPAIAWAAQEEPPTLEQSWHQESPPACDARGISANPSLSRWDDGINAATWDMQRGDELPVELRRRLNTSRFSYPAPPLPFSPFPRPYNGLRQALRRPPWHPATMRGRLLRVRCKGESMRFDFYLELPGYQLLMMVARKLTRSLTPL